MCARDLQGSTSPACGGGDRVGGAEVREMHGLAEWKGKGILIKGTGELGE